MTTAYQAKSVEESCFHTREATFHGETFVLTFELRTHSEVGAVIVVSDVGIGANNQYKLFSDFRVFVGSDPENYEMNQECPGGPFLQYSDYPSVLTSWPYGAEIWCNLPGKYVTIVRDYSAEAELAYELTLCNVSIFGE